MKIIPIALLCIIGNLTLFAQKNSSQLIQQFLEQEQERLELQRADYQDWIITDQHTSSTSNSTHIYIQQIYQGIPIQNGRANFAIKDQKVVSMGNRLQRHLQTKINYTTPQISPKKAVKLAAQELDLTINEPIKVVDAINNKHFVFGKSGISLENIPVQLMYFATEKGAIQLVWDLSIYTLDAQNWWSIRLDAQTGKLLDKSNWVTHCSFDHSPFVKCSAAHSFSKPLSPLKTMAPDQYTVFALPLESPTHGTRSTVTNPADTMASPYGWHDTDGTAGAEYTITRGNNVYAYEDSSDTNSPGFSPDGGSVLEFNFPYNNAADPTTYIPAAITNLFYMNNMMHDVWYRYGFDEASGNFQENNYNNGGQGGDYVRAEAQDGSGTNNANFATPPEGNRPRMQMYIWPFNSNTGNFLTVQSPSNIANSYFGIKADFGPPLPAVPISGEIVLAEDAVAPINDGCDPLINTAQLAGKIAMIDQGGCNFVQKVQAAQDAGAVAVVIANTTGFLFTMAGTSATINIPSIMVLPAVANAIKAELASGVTVQASIDNAGISDKDSDLDNGIIAHEYGHGISIRLTGGGSNSNCLNNAEQMGEGWSDWFGLMLTMEPGDQGSDVRGIGTYVSGEPTTGSGIRPAPYSTDFAVNNYTYANSNNTATISQPHGVGFIFATVLWDLNWALIDQYGGTPDPDLFNGTGGNNIAMNLVIEGLKLQPCNPGMIDGRDAILQADQLLYNGAHECLIWEVFAKRGFGYSANQGSSASRTDQTEAFDLSPVCLIASAPPIAAFGDNNLNNCVSTIQFTDSSTSTPQQWLWDFGDGNTSTQQNPTHTYLNDGTYTIKLVVTNNMGADSSSKQITITLPPAPIAIGDEVCAGDTATLTASGTGAIRWVNSTGAIIASGDTLIVPNVASQQYFYATNTTGAAAQYIGAVDTAIGNGAFRGSTDFDALNFYAYQPLEISSVWVYAENDGSRTFFLSTEHTGNGNTNTIIQDANKFLTAGWQKVDLNFIVPVAGNYNLGGSDMDLYYNSDGATYPYTVASLMRIDSASGTAPLQDYYYFYNIEIQEPRCVSVADTAVTNPITSYFTYTSSGNTFDFSDGSVGATSWFWDFGDGNTSTQQNPSHTYNNNSTYTVSLSINGGNCISSQVINDVLSINHTTSIQPKLYLAPNPNNGQSMLLLDRPFSEALTIQISGIDGKILQTHELTKGNISFPLDLQEFAAGVYYIRVQGSSFYEIRKLIKH